MNAVHPLQTSSRRWLPLQPAEWALLVAAAALLAFAVWGPFLPASAHQHDFADQRGWQGLPCALDVLSNLPFAVAGVWGLVWLRRLGALRLCPATRATAALFFGGLVLTAVGSGWYHWQPDDAGLLWDRLGMAAAFAGLLGLAVVGRISPRAGVATALGLLVAGPAAVLVWAHTGNLLPWAVVQFGGLLAVLALACMPHRPGAVQHRRPAVRGVRCHRRHRPDDNQRQDRRPDADCRHHPRRRAARHRPARRAACRLRATRPC